MSVASSRPPGAAPRVAAALLPIVAVVLIAFLVIGLAMPVLPHPPPATCPPNRIKASQDQLRVT
jgi:hypothetical protein